MNPEAEIAMEARRLRVLARRPELIREDHEERAERALSLGDAPGPLHYLDYALVAGAGPLHLVMARAVRAVSRRGARAGVLIDVLTELGSERIVAMHYAVPPKRRARLLRNPDWNHAVATRGRGVAEALALIERMVAETNSPWTPDSQAAAVIQFMSGARRDAHLVAIARAPAGPGPRAIAWDDDDYARTLAGS